MVREDGIYRTEVHVAGICIREDNEGDFQILIGKRTEDRDLFPGYWECGGGLVGKGEDFEDAIRQQFKQEFGLNVSPVIPI